MSYISGVELSSLDIGNVLIFQVGTLKFQAKKISYLLRVYKSKFIHSSS